jgi:hypothetical protein
MNGLRAILVLGLLFSLVLNDTLVGMSHRFALNDGRQTLLTPFSSSNVLTPRVGKRSKNQPVKAPGSLGT